MLSSSLLLDNLFELVESLVLELALWFERLVVVLKFLDLLSLRYLVVLQSGDDSLQFSLVGLLIVRDILEIV